MFAHIRNIRGVIVALMVLTSTWTLLNSSVNLHSHLINGKLVTHAHPYASTPASKHSPSLLQLLELLSDSVTNGGPSNASAPTLAFSLHLLYVEVQRCIKEVAFEQPSQRGPPIPF